jgi:hypothetical protein
LPYSVTINKSSFAKGGDKCFSVFCGVSNAIMSMCIFYQKPIIKSSLVKKKISIFIPFLYVKWNVLYLVKKGESAIIKI